MKCYVNACQKCKSGKLFSFSMLTDQKNTFPDWKMTKFFPYFSRLGRNHAFLWNLPSNCYKLEGNYCHH